MIPLRSVLFSALLLAAACAPAPRKPAIPALTGEWVLTTTSPMGAQDADMTVSQTGTQLSGKLAGPQGPVGYAGTLEGDRVQFSFTLDADGQPMKIEYIGVVAGDAMSGKTVFGPLGEGTFTAKRKSP